MPRPAELLVSVLESTFTPSTSYLAHVQGQVHEVLEGCQVARCWDCTGFCCVALHGPPLLVFCPFSITFVLLLLPH